jgi:hypothetical protein
VPLASFLDKPGVAPGIVFAYVALIFTIKVLAPDRKGKRPLGIWLVVGIFVLLMAMAFADWLIDSVL